ncbi:DUF6766 family protein [Actinosynnema sp. NPDC059335]|uniref:DUF6766 family protein n=1 Tax=Actinosynnema sp. NPDC059335 TaxID=3346804 RepID=UPI00366D10D2
MKRFLRDNGLGLAFGLLFLASLVGQAFAGNPPSTPTGSPTAVTRSGSGST